ncbi:MAG TPA: ATP-binding protein, partial [Stellaceae bacterium]|nr:ATP-binding protein [Stellaceae bacterium]
QRFKQLFEAASDWFFELDKDEFITYISPNFQALFGVPSDIVGKRFVDFPGAEFDPAELERIRAARRARQPYRDFVYARIFPSGEKRWLSSSAAPIFDENGEWQGYRGVVTDITERMRAEAFARLAQRRLHDAVSYVRQPFVVYDAQDRVVSFNHAFALLHSAPGEKTAVRQGVSFHELAQWQVLSDFYAGGEAIDSETLLARYQSGGEHTYHLTDDRWMLVGYRRLPDGGAVGLWTDVSALKRAEAERRVLEARLHHSQRLEALGMLAGGIAHDLNNSLVPVLALTKMVAGRLPEGDRSRANLETVVKAAQRSRDLVQQIVAFSRQEEQRRESVDLAAIAADALRLLRASIPSSIRLEEALAPVPTVDGDPGQLHQIIVNLVTNAAQAIGEAHGTIGLRVELDDDGGHARLTVSDTGCGMAEETRARIFEPFFTTRSVGQGTGLGLSVVHGIVASHGGRIDVETAPGKGSRFDVILPLPRSMA